MSEAEPVEEITNNVEASRYEISLDSRRVGLADYYLRPADAHLGEAVVIPHTETDPQFGGRGLASRLIRFALDDIAASGRLVVPACPFVANFIERHPEYQRLLG